MRSITPYPSLANHQLRACLGNGPGESTWRPLACHDAGAERKGARQVECPSTHLHFTFRITVYRQTCSVHLIAGGKPHYTLLGEHLSKFTMIYEGAAADLRDTAASAARSSGASDDVQILSHI